MIIRQRKKDKKVLERFYSAVMAGEYTPEQYYVTKIERVPVSDAPDDYYAYCNKRQFRINGIAFKKCKIGDCIVGVTVKGMPTYSVLILLNAENEQPVVADENYLYRLKYRMP